MGGNPEKGRAGDLQTRPSMPLKLIEDDKRGKPAAVRSPKMVEDLPTGESLNIMDEYERIQQNIKMIHESVFIPNADKIVAHRKQMHKLERLNKQNPDDQHYVENPRR